MTHHATTICCSLRHSPSQFTILLHATRHLRFSTHLSNQFKLLHFSSPFQYPLGTTTFNTFSTHQLLPLNQTPLISLTFLHNLSCTPTNQQHPLLPPQHLIPSHPPYNSPHCPSTFNHHSTLLSNNPVNRRGYHLLSPQLPTPSSPT